MCSRSPMAAPSGRRPRVSRGETDGRSTGAVDARTGADIALPGGWIGVTPRSTILLPI
jgi:hypothetical protein